MTLSYHVHSTIFFTLYMLLLSTWLAVICAVFINQLGRFMRRACCRSMAPNLLRILLNKCWHNGAEVIQLSSIINVKYQLTMPFFNIFSLLPYLVACMCHKYAQRLEEFYVIRISCQILPFVYILETKVICHRHTEKANGKKHVEMFAEWQAGFTSYVYPLQHSHNSVNIQMNGIVKETSNKWRSNSRAYHQSGYKTRHNGTKDRLSFLCFGHVKAVVRQRRIWKYLHCTLVQPMYTTYDL